MSPPQRIKLCAEPLHPEKCRLWLRTFKQAEVKSHSAYALAQAVLGFEIEIGSHRKYALPMDEAARLMGASPKTALKFMRPGQRLGSDRRTPALAGAVWAASVLIEQVFSPGNNAGEAEWLEELRLAPEFFSRAQAFQAWFNRIFGQMELPGLEYSRVAFFSSREAFESEMIDGVKRPATSSRGFLYCFAARFETFEDWELKLGPLIESLREMDIIQRMACSDEEAILQSCEPGSELCFDYEALNGHSFIFAPLLVSWAKDPFVAAREFRGQLQSMDKAEIISATSVLPSQGHEALAWRHSNGRRHAIGWVSEAEGRLFIQFDPALSHHGFLFDMFLGYKESLARRLLSS